MQGRMTPRLIGFLSEVEREFFELFCSVDGVGVKKALRAMVRPVKEVATAIEEQDAKLLSALPGIGPAMSERIIAKLRRKVPKFALMVAQQEVHEAEVESDVVVGDLRGSAAAWAIRRATPGGCWTPPCRPRRNTPTCRTSCRRSISRATSRPGPLSLRERVRVRAIDRGLITSPLWVYWHRPIFGRNLVSYRLICDNIAVNGHFTALRPIIAYNYREKITRG